MKVRLSHERSPEQLQQRGKRVRPIRKLLDRFRAVKDENGEDEMHDQATSTSF